jgi:uncharacterized protein (DUF433 family)
MTDEQLLERIVVNPQVMVGKPIIRGTRLTVEYIVDRIAHNATTTDLISEYEGLTVEDISACLLFAKKSLSETDFLPLLSKVS